MVKKEKRKYTNNDKSNEKSKKIIYFINGG